MSVSIPANGADMIYSARECWTGHSWMTLTVFITLGGSWRC